MAYAGNRHAYEYFPAALEALLERWSWSAAQRQRIVVRADAEYGTDANLRLLLKQQFQVLLKGYSGRRTHAWVKRLPDDAWLHDPQHPHRWAAVVGHPVGAPLRAWVVCWRVQDDTLRFATLVTTLPGSVFDLWALYDGRGANETEIRADKSGLRLTKRRKRSFHAQEGWLVLTDIAHNLLAWTRDWMLVGSRFASFGPQRIIEDVLTIPGRLVFDGIHLQQVALVATHPYAAEMRTCLQTLLLTFDLEDAPAQERGAHSPE